MTAQKRLKAELYRAFLKTTLAVGPELKKLSWFRRNHIQQMKKPTNSIVKKAA